MQLPVPVRDWMQLPPAFNPSGPLPARRLRYKRWIYLLLNGEDHSLGLAWVDLGYASQVFGHYSPQIPAAGEALSFVQLRPGPAAGLRQRDDGWQLQAELGRLRLEIRHLDGQGYLNLATPRLAVAAEWAAGPRPLLWADAPWPHHTHKSFAQPARWRLQRDGRRRSAEGLLGADVSCGFPPRHTRWHWAFAQSPELGFNLVEGFVGAAECALWRDGGLEPLAEGRFERPSGEGPWRIRTADERLNLSFEPVSAYRDRTRLGLVRSDFIQAYGLFRGRLAADRPEVRLWGVAEFQDSLW